MKQKILLLSILILAVALPFYAQKVVKLKDYVLSDVGDEWQYKNLAPDGLSPIIVKVSAKRDFKGISTFKRDENNGDYRLQTIDDKGLTIYQLYFVGERFIEYEKPILLMPPKLKFGEIYQSKTPYKTFVKGELKEQGMQTYEVTAQKFEDVKLGDKTYKNCLLIKTKALRIDESGTQKGYELLEWHAKNIGAVKINGNLFWINAKGETTRNFKVNAELEKNTLGK
jgi:hypothetical protein